MDSGAAALLDALASLPQLRQLRMPRIPRDLVVGGVHDTDTDGEPPAPPPLPSLTSLVLSRANLCSPVIPAVLLHPCRQEALRELTIEGPQFVRGDTTEKLLAPLAGGALTRVTFDGCRFGCRHASEAAAIGCALAALPALAAVCCVDAIDALEPFLVTRASVTEQNFLTGEFLAPLAELPTLEALSVSVSVSTCSRAASDDPDVAVHAVMHTLALSAAPALTSLRLCLGPQYSAAMLCAAALPGPGLGLRQLVLDFDEPIVRAVGMLQAQNLPQLTSLVLKSCSTTPAAARAQEACLPALARHCSALSALQELWLFNVRLVDCDNAAAVGRALRAALPSLRTLGIPAGYLIYGCRAAVERALPPGCVLDVS